MYLVSQNRYEELLLQLNKISSFQQAEECNFKVYNVKNHCINTPAVYNI